MLRGMNHRLLRCSAGLTLTEMMVSLFLSANILVAVGLAFSSSIQFFQHAADRQGGITEASLAMRMVERETARISCMSDTASPPCGNSYDNLVRFWDPANPGANFMSGRVQDINGNDSYFRFEYDSSAHVIRYCASTSFTQVCPSSALVIARNIYNNSYRMFNTENGNRVTMDVFVLESMDGSTPQTRWYHTAFPFNYSS